MLDEARFYGIEDLVTEIERLIAVRSKSPDSSALTRRDVINALISTPCTRELRFQVVTVTFASSKVQKKSV